MEENLENKQIEDVIVIEDEVPQTQAEPKIKKGFKLTPIKPHPSIALLGYVGLLFFYLTPVITFLSSIAVGLYLLFQFTSNFGMISLKKDNEQLESFIMSIKTFISFIAYALLVLISFIALCKGAFSLDFITDHIYGPDCPLNAANLIMYLIPLFATPGCYWFYLYLLWDKKKWEE